MESKMTKGFMEVFPELVLEQEVRALFEKVKVERVTTTRQKDLIRVYISCGRLIPQSSYFPGRGRDCKAAVSELQYHDQNSGKISAVSPVQPKEPAGNLSGEHFTGIKGMQPGGIQSVQISAYFLPG